MLTYSGKRKMIRKIYDHYPDQHQKNSPLTKPQSITPQIEEEGEKVNLRNALLEAIQQNQILRERVVQLQAMTVEAQELIKLRESELSKDLQRLRTNLKVKSMKNQIRNRSL